MSGIMLYPLFTFYLLVVVVVIPTKCHKNHHNCTPCRCWIPKPQDAPWVVALPHEAGSSLGTASLPARDYLGVWLVWLVWLWAIPGIDYWPSHCFSSRLQRLFVKMGEKWQEMSSLVFSLDVGDRKSALGLVTGGYVNVKSGQQDKGEYRTFDNVRSQLVCCWRPIAKRVTTFSISDTPFELWRLCHTCAHTSCSFNKWYHTSFLWKYVGSDGSSPNLLTSFSQTLSFPDCSYEWGMVLTWPIPICPKVSSPVWDPIRSFLRLSAVIPSLIILRWGNRGNDLGVGSKWVPRFGIYQDIPRVSYFICICCMRVSTELLAPTHTWTTCQDVKKI